MHTVEMAPGLMIFTYMLIFVCGVVMGAAGVASWWLYVKYRELLSNIKNIKVEIVD